MFSNSILPLLLIIAKTLLCSPLPMEGNHEITPSQTSGGESSSHSRPPILRIYHPTGPGDNEFEIEEIYSPHPDYKLGPIPIEDREMTQGEIEEVRDDLDPPKSMDDIIKQGIAKGILTKYDLQVLHPHIWELFLSPRAPHESQVIGREHLIGHPGNTRYFTESFDAIWPQGATLTPEQEKEKANAKLTLQRCLQAMRYLHKHDDAAAYHEATFRILLNPRFNPELAKEVAKKYSEIPKLRYRHDRSHFTKVAKPSHLQKKRIENGVTIYDSTSSEEEEG